MKKLLLVAAVFASIQSVAQRGGYFVPAIKDSRVEALMDKRMLGCEDIYYNSLTLIPQLYRSGQTDTLDAVVSYWGRYCGLNEANVAFMLLNSIKKGTFEEALLDPHNNKAGGRSMAGEHYQDNIISFLTEYCRMFSAVEVPGYYVNYYREAGEQYKSFIKELAVSLMKNELSPAEKFLVEFYADPDVSRFKRLTDTFYNGTTLQRAYSKQTSFGGLYMGIGSGVWHPTGKLAFIGDHPTISFHTGGRGERFYVDCNVQVRFLNSPNTFQTIYQGSLVNSRHHVGIFLGGDAGYALLKGKIHELDVQGGIGYDGLEVVAGTSNNNNSNNNDNSKTLGSLNLGAGLGYRLYLTHHKDADNVRHSFVQLLARYNAVSYRNPGGTDFTGNAITFGIIYGGYYNGTRKYYEPK